MSGLLRVKSRARYVVVGLPEMKIAKSWIQLKCDLLETPLPAPPQAREPHPHTPRGLQPGSVGKGDSFPRLLHRADPLNGLRAGGSEPLHTGGSPWCQRNE